MIKGHGGMGSHKHGVSGRATKSPRLRHWMKRVAEADERKPRRSTTKWKSTIKDLLKED